MDKQKTVNEQRDFYKKIGYSKLESLLLSLDDKLTGKKLYDWYWWFIWSNIKKPYDFLKKKKSERRYRKQRIKNTLSEQDAWNLNGYLLEVLYQGLTKYFMKGEFGPNWNDKDFVNKEKVWCETHNKKFYKDSINYIKLYEKYEKIVYSDDSTLEETYKIEEELNKFFTKYISKYARILWW